MKEEDIAGSSNRVVDFLGKEWRFDCMGCAISKKTLDIPGDLIYEGKYSILATDPLIPIPGFLVITLKRHINSFSQLSKEERNEISDVLVNAEKALKEECKVNEITLVQEERCPHFHIWIFPHYEWMNQKFGKGVNQLRDIFTYAQEKVTEEDIKQTLRTVENIREYLLHNTDLSEK